MSNQGDDVLRLLKEEFVEEMMWSDVYWYIQRCVGCSMVSTKARIIEYIPVWRQKWRAKAKQLSSCDFDLEPKEPIQQRLG